MARPLHSPDIEVQIAFLPTSEGGKTRSVRSGYRPEHDFGIPGVLFGGHHELVGQDSVPPGESSRSLLWLLNPEPLIGRLSPGLEFTVQEGLQVVARGVIIKVINQALRSCA